MGGAMQENYLCTIAEKLPSNPFPPPAATMSAEPAFTTSAIVASTASASHVLKIDGYSRTKGLAVGVHLRSCSFHVGGHSWHLAYLPNGDCVERSDYISIYLVLDGTAPGTAGGGPVLAQFSISLLDRAGKPAPTYTRTGTTNQFSAPGAHWGFPGFIRREVLEKSRHLNLKDDSFCVRCDVTVVTEFRAEDAATIAAEAAAVPVFVGVPPSDLSRHLGHLLLNEQGADVRFRVDGEDFPAHRCVLAVRSPVFQAELFGTMKEASSEAPCVEIHDMRADVFKNLLHFMYTDSLPEPEEPHDEEALMAQHLLVAADRYDMERLKLICEDTLCRHIEVSNAATTLALAEQHRCQGLKDACFQFLKTPGALNAVMATEDFDHLAVSCPSLIKELMSKLAAR
ncbi:BTB/POZ and MATH domain-containing protein 2 [Setaria italica]|nr:BTB/POZ and MATH domain-containing protein 2 [Setaria italica]